jgi:hypothetical protein
MLNLRHLASATFALATVCAPAAARAQTFPGIPLPNEPPAPYAAPSPSELPPPVAWGYERQYVPKQWYGWQILIPTLASDALILGGAIGAGAASSSTGSNVAAGMVVGGLAGHGLSGPIVHLAHGHPLKALASLGLEGALPTAFILAATLTPCNGEICGGNILAGVIGVPIALTAGAAIDAAALAWEDAPGPRYRTGLASISLAPQMVAPPTVGASQVPRPTGVALVGTF